MLQYSIGHSLGFAKALSFSGCTFDKVIGLNAFVNFLGFDSTLRQSRTREYKAFSKNFKDNPKGALVAFQQQIGIHNPICTDYDMDKLRDDLLSLKDTYTLNTNTQYLILQSIDDMVVPVALSLDNFQSSPATLLFLELIVTVLGITTHLK